MNALKKYKNSFNNIKEKIISFKDKNHKSKKKYENCKTDTSVLESIDTDVIIGTSTTSVTPSVTGVGLIVVPISAEIGCTSIIVNKVLHKIKLNKENQLKKQDAQQRRI